MGRSYLIQLTEIVKADDLRLAKTGRMPNTHKLRTEKKFFSREAKDDRKFQNRLVSWRNSNTLSDREFTNMILQIMQGR